MTQITVALLSTSLPGSAGSMSAFSDIVRRALTAHASDITLLPIDLCDPTPRPASRLAQRLQLVQRAVAARRRSERANACVYHLLDGSHAYMIGKIPWSRTLVTVHDLIPALQARGCIDLPQPSWAARRLTEISLRSISRAGAVHAVSQNTAKDLRELTGRVPDATILSPLRMLPKVYGAETAGAQSSSHPPYILHVGNNGDYKNRRGVIEIFSRVIENRPNLTLKLAGPEPSRELRALANTPALTPRVKFVVNPDDSELARLYHDAELLLFPSLYEGFGWPPLEAAYYGCPVVCSNVASLPEAVGDSALMCDPVDPSGFASAVLRLISDRDLAKRLVRNGYRNLERLNDRRLAVGLSELYTKLIDEAVRPAAVVRSA